MKPTREQQIVGEAAKQFMKIPGVHAVAFGLKRIGGERIQQLAVQVKVDRKRPANELSTSELIPKQFQGLPTDVIEEGRATFAADTDRYRPLEGGCQICAAVSCNLEGKNGTLGCICLDLANDGAASLLTNYHVLSDADEGDRIYQPTAACQCSKSCANVAGFYTRGGYLCGPTDTQNPIVDGAIAALKSNVTYSSNILDIGAVAGIYSLTPQDVIDEMVIRKRGRTTKLTYGILDSIYGQTKVKDLTFISQINVANDPAQNDKFADHGDSGAVLMNSDNEVVGLLATIPDKDAPVTEKGSGSGSPIDSVLSLLNIEVYVGSDVAAGAGAGKTDPLEELAARVENEVKDTPRGRPLVEAFHRHQSEIFAFPRAHRRVAAAWRRQRGLDFYQALVQWAENPTVAFPNKINEIPTRTAVDRIAVELLRYGSALLRADILRVIPNIRALVGRTYPEFLQELRAGRLDI